jgi:hypothetical protein
MGIVLMILGFIWWWPIGLLVLGFLISRRCGYWRRPMYAGDGDMHDWNQFGDRFERKMGRLQERAERKMDRMQEKMGRLHERMERFRGGRDWFSPSSSGNRAFDDYRAETLKRLEDEQREFKEFLERLRFAKDRAEFDQFMAERRNRPSGEAPPPPSS